MSGIVRPAFRRALAISGSALCFSAALAAAEDGGQVRVYPGAEATQRYGAELINSLPQLAGISDPDMSVVIITSQDIRNAHKVPLSSRVVDKSSDEWKAVQKTFDHFLLSMGLPDEVVTDIRNGTLDTKRRDLLDDALINLLDPHETATVINLGRKICLIAAGDNSEMPAQMGASFADSSVEDLPRLQELADAEQVKWLLLHEARHCTQPYGETPLGRLTGDEVDADRTANKVFLRSAALTMRERAIVGLHLIRADNNDPNDMEKQVTILNRHATALPLFVSPDNPYAFESNTVAEAYRFLGAIVMRELYRTGTIESDAGFMVDDINRELAKSGDKALTPEARQSFERAKAVLLLDDDAGFRKLMGPYGSPLDPFESFLINNRMGSWGSLNKPLRNAPILSAYLKSGAEMPRLARIAGLLYLRAVADLNPALEPYALPMPEGIAFPPLPAPAQPKLDGATSLLRKTPFIIG